MKPLFPSRDAGAIPHSNSDRLSNMGSSCNTPIVFSAPHLSPTLTGASPSENCLTSSYCGLASHVPYLSTKPQRDSTLTPAQPPEKGCALGPSNMHGTI